MALAALSTLPQFSTAAEATEAGWERTKARAYYAPDGILLRMRLTACGVFNRGDTFRSSGDDTVWWVRTAYRPANLWDILATFAKLEDARPAIVAPHAAFDEEVARGEPGAVQEALVRVLGEDLPIFNASKCEPPHIFPLGPGMVPLPNPRCNVPEVDKDLIPKLGVGIPWWVFALVAFVLLDRDKRK